MARIVIVHGMNQHYSGQGMLEQELLEPLRDGIRAAQQRGLVPKTSSLPERGELRVAYWSRRFRPDPADLRTTRSVASTTDAEAQLLQAVLSNSSLDAAELEWLRVLSDTTPSRASSLHSPPGLGATRAARAPAWLQATLQSIGRTPFFQDLWAAYGPFAVQYLLTGFRQMHAYMGDPSTYRAIQETVCDAIGPDTRVVIGHSLGSVIAYEALCEAPKSVQSFVTLGSPLGARGVIYEKLLTDRSGAPAPRTTASKPRPRVRSWTNVVDLADLLAPEKRLDALFDRPIRHQEVYNGKNCHDIKRYLNTWQTGEAVAI